MTSNVGTADRIARAILGLGILSLFFFLGNDVKWYTLIGIVPLVTGIFGFCPAYGPFGINTRGCSKGCGCSEAKS